VKIGGLEEITLIDYYKKIACIVFLSGCNFRCPWCYAPELVIPSKIRKHPQIEEDFFLNFLRKRRDKLDGVVVCGGEPTIHKELPFFLEKIKKEGFLVKLDTNGTNPKMIMSLIEEKLVDYIAMDIKGPLNNYKRYTLTDCNIADIRESIEIIKRGKTDYEFRTTAIPEIHKKDDFMEIGREISGARRYFIQSFLAKKTIDKNFLKVNPFTKEELTLFKKKIEPFVKNCEIR